MRYVVVFTNGYVYQFDADDFDHAREQAKDAEPDLTISIVKPVYPKPCSLRDEWRTWSKSKQEDRLFMTCPECGAMGSHVQ